MMVPILIFSLLALPQIKQSSLSTSPPAKNASVALLEADARLTKKTTIHQSEISINQLLTTISEETGVSLKMRDQKRLGNAKICAYAKDVEAFRLLEALEAIFRYKHASSEWGKTVDGDGYALSTGAKDFLLQARQVKKEASEKFLRNVDASRNLLDKSKNELSILSGRNQALTGTGSIASRLLFQENHNQTWLRDGLNAFFHGLSRDEQRDILAGNPLTITNPAENKYFASLLETAPARPDGNKVTIDIEATGFAPVLHIMANGSGYNYVGSRFDEKEAREPLIDDWFTKYDQKSVPEEKETVKVKEGYKLLPLSGDWQDNVADLLSTLAELQNIPILALLAPRGNHMTTLSPVITTSPDGKAVEQILDGLGDDTFDLKHKWSGNVLLLRDPVAPFLEALRIDAETSSTAEKRDSKQ